MLEKLLKKLFGKNKTIEIKTNQGTQSIESNNMKQVSQKQGEWIEGTSNDLSFDEVVEIEELFED